MTSAPVRDPLADHRLTPQDVALLLIDSQPCSWSASTRWTARCRSRTGLEGRYKTWRTAG